MKVLVAPTAFKGTMAPTEAADAMAVGVRRIWPDAEVEKVPLSDGGDGLLEAAGAMYGGGIREVTVAGPLGDRVSAPYLQADDLCVLESAKACGLHLISEDRLDPLRASSRGVGELVRAVVPSARRILLGLGGSATVDGGTGMGRALGWRFLGPGGAELPEGGGSLCELEHIEAPDETLDFEVVALCDVSNPLLGPEGGIRVYSPQKGAGPEEVELLEEGFERLIAVLERDRGLNVRDVTGAGAAGGLGAGALAFLSAELRAGADWMIEATGLAARIAGADLLLTGEGRFDVQSSMGKITGQVLDLSRSLATPAVLVCGRVDGPLPNGVTAAGGSGVELDAMALSRLVESACRAVPRGDTL